MKHAFMKKIVFCFVFLIICSSISANSLLWAQATMEVDVPKVEYSASRDPFRSPFEVEKKDDLEMPPVEDISLGHLKVQGMVWDTEMPQAIINDKVVKVGEVIEGAKILEITKECIYVLYDGKQYMVKPEMPKALIPISNIMGNKMR